MESVPSLFAGALYGVDGGELTPNPIHINAPTSVITNVYSQSGQVKLQNRKSIFTSSVFWIKKMSSSPTPVSPVIAPPLSRRPCRCAGPFLLSPGVLSSHETSFCKSHYEKRRRARAGCGLSFAHED